MGRRVARKEEEKKKSQLRIKIGAGIVATLGVAYLATCAVVPKEVITQGVVMNGVEVGGMTKEEAAKALAEKYETDYEQASLKVKVEEQEYNLPVHSAITFDEKAAADEAYAYAHSNFLLRGAQMLFGKMTKVTMDYYPALTEKTELGLAVMNSGISSVNSTIQTTYELTDTDLQISMGKKGHSVDMQGLNKALATAVSRNNYTDVIEAPLLEGTVESLNMDSVYEKLHKKKREATLDVDNDYQLVTSITGIDFNKEEAAKTVASAKEGDVLHVEIQKDEPKISTEDMKKHLFEKTVGSCTTSVSGSYERVSNVSLAASTINGIILMPGEEFSYNNRVGERTAARGYKKAPAYSNGESILELGGGVCQVSSTLYKAVVLSNLEVIEHHNHTYESAYIGLGMDATVSWDGPDFRFKNNTDYPIKIIMEYGGGSLECRIKGAKLDDNHVLFTNEVLQVIPYGTKTEKDKTLAKGKTKKISGGHNGYKVQTYRTIVDKNGNVISRTKEDYNVYSKKDEVVAKGTKEVKKPEKKPENTTQAASSTTPVQKPGTN